MAFFQFIGFMVGGLAVYAILHGRPTCKPCNKYLRPLIKKSRLFGDTDRLANYYDGLFQNSVDSPEFEAMVKETHKDKVEKGAFTLEEALYGCPSCKQQMIWQNVKIFNGQDWKDIDKLTRRVNIPEGLNLVPVFK